MPDTNLPDNSIKNSPETSSPADTEKQTDAGTVPDSAISGKTDLPEPDIEQTRREMLNKYGRRKDEDDEEKKKYGLLLPRRTALWRAAKRVLWANKITLILIALAAIITVAFLVAASYERMGNFTINLNRIELYRKGFALSDTYDFEDPKARLVSESVKQATNISIDDIPDNLHLLDGNNNDRNYVAYTFYIGNEKGRLSIAYKAQIVIEMVARNVDKAVRVMVYEGEGDDLVKTVYAKPAADGSAETGTVPFLTDALVMERDYSALDPGEYDKYTVIIWLEGDDPDCTDELIGGMIRMRMDFDAIGDDAEVSTQLTELPAD